MNLERARAAALSGDQISLAEELNKNVGTYDDFLKMNVLQQKAVAEAVGLTADQLSDQLRKQKMATEQGKSLAQVNADELADAQTRQNIQEKFNAAILKLQDFIGNLVAGPLGSFLGMLSDALNIIGWITSKLSFMATPLKIIAATYLAINAYKKIGLGIDIASKGQNMISANIGLATIASKKTQVALEKESFFTKVGANAQLLISLIREEGIRGIKTFAAGLEEKSLARKIIMGIYDGVAWVRAQAMAGFAAIKAAMEGKTVGYLIAQGMAMLKNVGLAISEAVAKISGASAVSLGIAGGIALAAGAAAYAFLKPKSVGDMISPADGKTQISTKEGGLFELSKNDDLMAGPGLSSKKGGDLIDLTPMIMAINAVKASVDRLYGKDSAIYIDGKKVGTTLAQGSHKVA